MTRYVLTSRKACTVYWSCRSRAARVLWTDALSGKRKSLAASTSSTTLPTFSMMTKCSFSCNMFQSTASLHYKRVSADVDITRWLFTEKRVTFCPKYLLIWSKKLVHTDEEHFYQCVKFYIFSMISSPEGFFKSWNQSIPCSRSNAHDLAVYHKIKSKSKFIFPIELQ